MVGGIRPSAGVVLPLLPPALLHYTINRRKLQAVRQKICAKKVKMLGGCALRGTGATCRCGACRREGGRAEPRRHLLSLPRGREPSQTPPSLATDSSISPGPPSPWLPALLIGKRFLSVLRRVGDSEGTPPPGAGLAGRASAARVQPRGCKGRSPLHKKTLILPLPHRGRALCERGSGG